MKKEPKEPFMDIYTTVYPDDINEFMDTVFGGMMQGDKENKPFFNFIKEFHHKKPLDPDEPFQSKITFKRSQCAVCDAVYLDHLQHIHSSGVIESSGVRMDYQISWFEKKKEEDL